jgi:hypothetical protein
MPFKIHPISVNYIDMSEKTKDGTKRKKEGGYGVGTYAT